MISRFLATIEISRPHNMIAAAGCVLSGYLLTGGRSLGDIWAPFAFTALVTGFGNLINDYHDRDIDQVNKPRRPIPSGRLTPAYVLAVYWVGSIATTLAMLVFVPVRLAALMIVWEVLLYYYARTGKRVALVGNLMIASIAASAFWGGAILTGNYGPSGFPMLLAFLLVMGRELVKGAEDVEGDRGAGASTLAVRYGAESSAYSGVVFLLLCVVAAPVPALIEHYGRTYSVVMELLFVPGVLVASLLTLRSPRRAALHRASWILKIQMFFGIVAMALGRV